MAVSRGRKRIVHITNGRYNVDLEVNRLFTVEGKCGVFQVVEAKKGVSEKMDCKLCDLLCQGNLEYKVMLCSDKQRRDNKGVHFERVM